MPSGSAEINSNSGKSATSGGYVKGKRQKHNAHWNSRMKVTPVTVESVRRIVEQEGRSARNLISWNAPLDMEEKHSESKSAIDHVRRPALKRRSKSCDINDKKNNDSKTINSGGRPTRENKTNSGTSRSFAAGKKQISIRARYWAYLFENLRRAVDEIYATCETDESVVECKEVLLVLDNYRHDFQALIDWINLQERLNSTDISNRPTSLAWEVRKSSPGRPRQRMTPRSSHGVVHFSGAPQIANTNSKTFSGQNIKRSNSDKKIGASSSSVTWADKVKGSPPVNAIQKSPQAQNGMTIINSSNTRDQKVKNVVVEQDLNSDDEGGWEKVSSKNKQPKMNRVHFNSNKGSLHSGEISNKQLPKHTNTGAPVFSTGQGNGPTFVKENNANNIVIINGEMEINNNEKIPAENLEFFVDSISDESPATPTAVKKNFNSKYSNMVVERSMGTASTSSFSEVKHGTNEPNSFTSDKGTLNKVLFDDDDDATLEALDDVEADYFKSGSLDDNEVESGVMESYEDSDSKANQALLEHDASIAAAEKAEQQLMKEIEEEENKVIDEDVENSAEAETPSGASSGKSPLENSQESSDWSSIMARFEAEQETHQGMTWGDMIDEEELREPGRAVQMHEKLSSPSRKRTPAESKRKMEEKQRSATLRRQKMVHDKTERIHVLTEKVLDVKKLKNGLISERRELLQDMHMEKLQRAEQQRAKKLMKIRQKAQAEETKVNEILFINELQEQNKRHDVLNRILEHDARLQEIQQERCKMQEVKAAKEENVKERRRLLEIERQNRLSEMVNKRKEQDSRIEQLKHEKEKEREKLAREKERERKIRLSALNAAQQEAVTELQKKIQIKHDESERRHQEQLEQRKEKAVELSLGKFSLSSSGNMQSGELQNTINEGENSALDTSAQYVVDTERASGDTSAILKNTQQDLTSIVSSKYNTGEEEKKQIEKASEDHRRECRKAMKKRAKKLKTRMSSRGRDFLKALEQKPLPSSSSKNKVCRLVKDINRQLAANQKDSSGPWPANRISALDRALGEIHRLLENEHDDGSKALFRMSGGFEMLEQVFEVLLNSATFQGQTGETVSVIPDKTVGNAANTFKSACENCYDNVLYALYSSRLIVVVDALTQQLTKHFPEEVTQSNVKSPVVGRKASTNKNATTDNIFDTTLSSLLDALAFCVGFLASQPLVQDDGKIEIRENKQLLRALKSTIVTSGRKGSIDVNDMDPKKAMEGYLNRGLDVVSYAVSCGVLDKLSIYLESIRSEVEADSKATVFIKSGLSFLYSVTDFVALRNRCNTDTSEGRTRRTSTSSNNSANLDKKAGNNTSNSIPRLDSQIWETDPTHLLPTLYHTEVMGVVSVLYGILLRGAPERPIILRNNSMVALEDVTDSSPPQKTIPQHVLEIATSVMLVLNAVADLDIHLLQESLGAEGVSLEFRHICTYLLWYCQHTEHEALLHEVIVCVGHFSLCNKKNQDTVHSGAMPTVLQQLCVLPFSYFSNPRLSNILFPTLIACCHDNSNNLAMLEQEASGSLLSTYIQGILANCETEENYKSGTVTTFEDTTLKSVPLSSSRLYTVPFLKDAMLFFAQTVDSNVPNNTIKT